MKKALVIILLITLYANSFSFTKWDKRVSGKWRSEKLKTGLVLKANGKFEMRVTPDKKPEIKITGYWRATQKYLYLEYFSLIVNNEKRVYYKTMIYRIIKITRGVLLLKHRYNLDILTFNKLS